MPFWNNYKQYAQSYSLHGTSWCEVDNPTGRVGVSNVRLERCPRTEERSVCASSSQFSLTLGVSCWHFRRYLHPFLRTRLAFWNLQWPPIISWMARHGRLVSVSMTSKSPSHFVWRCMLSFVCVSPYENAEGTLNYLVGHSRECHTGRCAGLITLLPFIDGAARQSHTRRQLIKTYSRQRTESGFYTRSRRSCFYRVRGWMKEWEGEKRVRRLEIDRERFGETEREGQWSKWWKEWEVDGRLDDRKRTEGICLPLL